MNNLNDTDFHLPYNPKLVERAKNLRKNMTVAEQKLWKNYLKTFKYRVLKQSPLITLSLIFIALV
jgi:very-short-patch-repair endonuclease